MIRGEASDQSIIEQVFHDASFFGSWCNSLSFWKIPVDSEDLGEGRSGESYFDETLPILGESPRPLVNVCERPFQTDQNSRDPLFKDAPRAERPTLCGAALVTMRAVATSTPQP